MTVQKDRAPCSFRKFGEGRESELWECWERVTELTEQLLGRGNQQKDEFSQGKENGVRPHGGPS